MKNKKILIISLFSLLFISTTCTREEDEEVPLGYFIANCTQDTLLIKLCPHLNENEYDYFLSSNYEVDIKVLIYDKYLKSKLETLYLSKDAKTNCVNFKIPSNRIAHFQHDYKHSMTINGVEYILEDSTLPNDKWKRFYENKNKEGNVYDASYINFGCDENKVNEIVPNDLLKY